MKEKLLKTLDRLEAQVRQQGMKQYAVFQLKDGGTRKQSVDYLLEHWQEEIKKNDVVGVQWVPNESNIFTITLEMFFGLDEEGSENYESN